jgi:transposase
LKSDKKRSKSKRMSDPTQYRKRTIEYRMEGHTLEKTSQTFKVSIATIREWEKQYKETGDLNKKPLIRRPKKLDPEKLKAYLNEHPDAYQGEVAETFGCTDTAVRKAYKRLGITRKKRQNAIESKSL